MGYQEELAAGFAFEDLTPHETCPPPGCGALALAHVRFVPPAGRKGPHIKAFCSSCDHRRELNLKTYGPRLIQAFPEIEEFLKPGRPKKRSKSFEAGSPEFYARFSWCCVYCEGFRLAKEYRLKQVSDLGMDGLINAAEPDQNPLDPDFEIGTSELIGTRALENIFDLVPDHIFPVWVQQLPGLAWEAAAKRKAEKDWVVSAHRSCNSKRKRRIEDADFLLFVYSRYLFPILDLTECERIDDVLAFAAVLRGIEVYKATNQIAELKPPRRAM